MRKQRLIAGVLFFVITFVLLTSVLDMGIVGAQSTVPVQGMNITASGPGGTGYALSDSQGHFTINKNLGSGTYSITAELWGYVETTIDNIVVTAGSTSNVTILMELSGVLVGKVTDASSGLPIQSAYVAAYNASGDYEELCTAITDANGNYRLATDLPTGTYTVTAHYTANHVSKTVSGISVTSGNATTFVNFALAKSGVIEGTITDAKSSAPLPSITIEATDAYGNVACVSHTDSSGKYSLDNNLPSGIYLVTTVNPSGHAPKIVGGLNVTAGSTTTLNLNLDPSGIISGKVTSSSGQPVPRASITARSGTSTANTTSDSDGNYRITDGLGTGTYSVKAISGLISNLVNDINVVQGQETSNVSITLAVPPSGTVTGKVTDSNGSPISYATVDAQGSTGSVSVVTDENGNYAITGLTAGSYKVTAIANGFQSASQNSVTVTANTVSSDVNFGLSTVTSGTISGIVIAYATPTNAQNTPTPEQTTPGEVQSTPGFPFAILIAIVAVVLIVVILVVAVLLRSRNKGKRFEVKAEDEDEDEEADKEES